MSKYSCDQTAAQEDEFWEEVTQDEKDFINTINLSAWVPSVFWEQYLSMAKWMIDLSWQNINRVEISQ